MGTATYRSTEFNETMSSGILPLRMLPKGTGIDTGCGKDRSHFMCTNTCSEDNPHFMYTNTFNEDSKKTE